MVKKIKPDRSFLIAPVVFSKTPCPLFKFNEFSYSGGVKQESVSAVKIKHHISRKTSVILSQTQVNFLKTFFCAGSKTPR